MSASAGQPRNPLRRAVATTASRLPWMVDAYRAARKPTWELAIRRDLVATRRSATFLRSAPVLPADAPVALLALYRDNIYETKSGLLLLSALRLHGYAPIVLIPSGRAHRVRRYAHAFGVDRVVASDSLALTVEETAECRAAAARLGAAAADFDSVKAWSFRGRAIGNHVLSTLIRTTFDGSPNLSVDDNQERLGAILNEVLTNVVRAERIAAQLEPAVALVEEANYSTNGPLVDVLVDHGIDVIQTIGIWREDALMSKRLTQATRRVDAKSVAPETLATIEAQPWTAAMDDELDRDFAARYGQTWLLGRQFQPDTEARSDEEIVAELGLDASRPTAVIFAHVLWDASLFFGVDLFENYSDWLVQSVGAAVGNANVNWIVKAHPSNVSRKAHGDISGESSEVTLVREHFPELPLHVHLLLPDTNISTLSLYRFADYGVTVRGTPGMEIASFGKPAFTAGTGTYAGLGFTYDSASTDEYLGRLREIHTYGPLPGEMKQRARRYAHTLFTRRPWPIRSFRIEYDRSHNGWHPLDRNVVLVAGNLAAIHREGDLDAWARWTTGSSDADYLPRPAAER